MIFFITGATGFIGLELTKQLLNQGDTVHALVRNPNNPNLPKHKNLNLFKGGLSDKPTVDSAMRGCDFVFHLAAYAKPWSKDKSLPYKINVEGTRNILESAFKNQIKKIVFTSSSGTLKPSDVDEPVDENSPEPQFYLTDYEKTKRQAEKLCIDYTQKGLDIVIVNPTRVYGPGTLNKSNSVTILIKKYFEGTWRFIPGNGKNIGNYVFIEDVVAGHLLALNKGKSSERYILGGDNISFNQLFEVLAKINQKKYRLFYLPLWIMQLVSQIMVIIANVFGIEPLITPVWVKRYNQNRVISSTKAIAKLGYSITTFSLGVKKTKNWLETKTKT